MRKLALILFLFMLIPSHALASDLEVQFAGSTGTSPLFTLGNTKPGDTQSKLIIVKNNTRTTQTPVLKIRNLHTTKSVDSVLTFLVSDSPPAVLSSIQSGISLIPIPSGLSRTYVATLALLSSAGNEFQGATAQFDIVIGMNTTTDIPAECSSISFPNPPIEGTDKANILTGTNGNDLIFAKGGNDLVMSKGGDDCIVGGAGNDILYGDSGNDILDGGGGLNIMFGGFGTDLCMRGLRAGCE